MAANTVHAEVNYTGPMNTRPEFFANDHSLDRVNLDPRVVPIVNGRAERPSLAREGIELFDCPTQVKEFRDAEAVARIYPHEIEDFIRTLTGADAVALMGPAILRFGERSPEAGTRDNSSAARLVHIDTSDSTALEFAQAAAPTRAAKSGALPSTTSGARSPARRRMCRWRSATLAPSRRRISCLHRRCSIAMARSCGRSRRCCCAITRHIAGSISLT
jgi:hypothetical protein